MKRSQLYGYIQKVLDNSDYRIKLIIHIRN
jgi:hypothetical protein